MPDMSASKGIEAFTGLSQGHVSDMMSSPVLPEGLDLASVPLPALSAGTTDDIVFRESGTDGFSLARIGLAPDYILPAHKHDVDCLYYVEKGWILLGRSRIDSGGGFMVRAHRAYGYRAGAEGATVLEFRNATSFTMTITETSAAKWQEIATVANSHDGWAGFVDSSGA